MPAPVLLAVVGSRAETLAAASFLEAVRARDPYDLPFRLRFLTTGQERTELDQALDALGLEPDVDLETKRPQLGDASLSAALLEAMERAVRREKPDILLTAGDSASAWAAGVSAYFKHVPHVQLEAGRFAPEAARPFPEWLHRENLAMLGDLMLCPNARAAENVRRRPAKNPARRVEVVGSAVAERLGASIDAARELEEDPTLRGLPAEGGRVLFFFRRREHHAEALRPFCDAATRLAERFAGAPYGFVALHSLQAHICDAQVALLPKTPNFRDVSPLPHPALVRELARARLVVTDSAGLAEEAALLGRPLLVVGRYALAEGAASAARVVPMEVEAIETAVAEALADAPPAAAPGRIDAPPAGERALEALLDWLAPDVHEA